MRSEWKKVKIADVCSFQNGFAFKSTEFSKSGIPIIKIKEMKDGEIKFFRDSAFIDDDIDKYGAYKVENGDILFALTGDPVSKNNPLSWVGRVSKYRGNAVCLLNQRVCKALVDELKISKDYLYSACRQESLAKFFNRLYNINIMLWGRKVVSRRLRRKRCK